MEKKLFKNTKLSFYNERLVLVKMYKTIKLEVK